MTLALLLAAGCTSSGGDTPPSSPPATAPATSPTTAAVPTSTVPTSPSATPTPTVPPDVPTTGPNLLRQDEKPPVEPVAATKHTAAGAKAFAEFFIRTIDWGYATMSGTYIRHYADQRCLGCSQFANGIDADRRAGDRYIGGRITVKSARLAPHRLGSGAPTILVVFDILSFEKNSKTGRFITGDGAHAGEQFEVALRWSGDHWSVVDLAADG